MIVRWNGDSSCKKKRKVEFFTTNGKKKNQNKIQDGELQEEEKERCKLIISTVEYIL